MCIKKLFKRGLALPCMAFLCATGWLSCGNAQEPHRDIPASWSEFEVFDGRWRCRVGYHRAGSYCVPATAPAHATYLAGGEHWECDWGFRKIASHCEEIKPPAHAYIDATGRDWACYPGFERRSDGCISTAGSAPPADK